MKINKSKIVTVDFETYWSTDYTLSSPAYNTSAYVRDKQFKIHCMAMKVGNKKTKMAHSQKEAEAMLRTVDWSTHALLAQNTAFDGFIMSHHFNIIPCYYFDTMSMTRGLHNEMSRANLADMAVFYGVGQKSKTYLTPTRGLRELPDRIRKGLEEGCILDADLCYEIAMKQLEKYPEDELDLIDFTVRMFCDSPLQVDLKMARIALREEMFEKRNAILKSGATEDELQSNPQFAAKLQALDVEPPSKISTKTHLHSWSFNQSDSDFMDLLEHEKKEVRLLMLGRLAAKSTQMETRANRLIQAGESGGLPVGYNYYAAKTGRWGGTNKLNLQNLPRVDADNPQPSDGLRRSIIAPAGHVLVVGDSAQIEARTNAWQAGQLDLLESFRLKRDPYCEMASLIYGRTITKADKLERFIGKIAILGLGYQMGARKFQTTLALGTQGPAVDLDLSLCYKIVNLYRTRNKMIEAGWEEGKRVLTRMCQEGKGLEKARKLDRLLKIEDGKAFGNRYEYEPGIIWLPNGMPMNYPGIMMTKDDGFAFKSHGKVKHIYGGLVIENLTQALARIIVGWQILVMRQELADYKLKKGEVAKIVMITHDEAVACVPTRLAKQTQGMMLDALRWVPEQFKGLPLDGEGSFARQYSK